MAILTFFQHWLHQSLSTKWLFHFINFRTWLYLIGSIVLTTDSVLCTPETANNIIMLIQLVSCQNCGDFLRQARYMAFHNWTCNRVGTGITWYKFAHYYHVILSSWYSVHSGYKFHWVISLIPGKRGAVNSIIWSSNKFLSTEMQFRYVCKIWFIVDHHWIGLISIVIFTRNLSVYHGRNMYNGVC